MKYTPSIISYMGSLVVVYMSISLNTMHCNKVYVPLFIFCKRRKYALSNIRYDDMSSGMVFHMSSLLSAAHFIRGCFPPQYVHSRGHNPHRPFICLPFTVSLASVPNNPILPNPYFESKILCF